MFDDDDLMRKVTEAREPFLLLVRFAAGQTGNMRATCRVRLQQPKAG